MESHPPQCSCPGHRNLIASGPVDPNTIAVLPGDGIGKEVVAQGLKVFRRVGELRGKPFEFVDFDLGADFYLKHGEVFPQTVQDELKGFKAIYFGAIGDPRVPPGVLEKGLLLALRFNFDMYINLRPVLLLKEDMCPLKGHKAGDIDFIVVRENTEGLYAGVGGTLKTGTPDEVALQEEVNTYKGVHRCLKYAFDLAMQRPRRELTMADKSNVLTYGHGLWQRVYKELQKDYPDVTAKHLYVDVAAMDFVRRPHELDVVVTNNLFGDILTDIGAVIQGGLGLAASGNLNPTGTSMFEPVHGSAPDIAGQGKANPLAAVLCAAMILDHLGEAPYARRVEKAVKDALENNETTPDLGGTLTTDQVGDAIIAGI